MEAHAWWITLLMQCVTAVVVAAIAYHAKGIKHEVNSKQAELMKKLEQLREANAGLREDAATSKERSNPTSGAVATTENKNDG